MCVHVHLILHNHPTFLYLFYIRWGGGGVNYSVILAVSGALKERTNEEFRFSGGGGRWGMARSSELVLCRSFYIAKVRPSRKWGIVLENVTATSTSTGLCIIIWGQL